MLIRKKWKEEEKKKNRSTTKEPRKMAKGEGKAGKGAASSAEKAAEETAVEEKLVEAEGDKTDALQQKATGGCSRGRGTAAPKRRQPRKTMRVLRTVGLAPHQRRKGLHAKQADGTRSRERRGTRSTGSAKQKGKKDECKKAREEEEMQLEEDNDPASPGSGEEAYKPTPSKRCSKPTQWK
ncbi:unnamed protein product [Toxocara canis]|uniref:High mobility group nucleosome-binding domain-containing protein 5 n=1 Tax=Toxocara canis TaxID=6265 RepID=A0A183VH59_TOXCA|nr:unnamed protein product [Toxocara canis]